MIYIIIFVSIVICGVGFTFFRRESIFPEYEINTKFLWNFNDSRIDNLCFIAISIVLFIMAATRDFTGYDWLNYHYFYDVLQRQEMPFFEALFHLYVEPGFSLLNIIIPDFYLLLLFVAIITVPVRLWAINKYSEAKYVSLLMYFTSIFLAYDMGIMRQAISISALFIGLQYIRDRKLLKFLLVILAGSFFHLSTLVFIPLYFVNFRNFSRKIIYIATGIALVFYFIDLSQVLAFFINLIHNEFITERLDEYLRYNNDLLLSLVKRIVILIFFVEFYKRYKVVDKMSLIFLNGYVLSVIFMAFLSSIPIFGERGAIGLYFLQIFIFAKLFAASPKWYMKVGVLAIVIALSLDTGISIIREGNMTHQIYTPYRSLIGHYWRVFFDMPLDRPDLIFWSPEIP
jgi:hypothetical protein